MAWCAEAHPTLAGALKRTLPTLAPPSPPAPYARRSRFHPAKSARNNPNEQTIAGPLGTSHW